MSSIKNKFEGYVMRRIAFLFDILFAVIEIYNSMCYNKNKYTVYYMWNETYDKTGGDVMGDVRKYVWCEDSSSGYIFWNVIFNASNCGDNCAKWLLEMGGKKI